MKKNFLKKAIPFAVMSLVVCTSACIGTACSSGKDKDKGKYDGPVSELIGRFSNNEDKNITLSNDKEKEGTLKPIVDNETQQVLEMRPYLYTSNFYPLNTIVEEDDIIYKSQQTLRLKRDYTYTYQYDIVLNKKFESSNKDVAKIEVTLNGTFDYLTGESDGSGTQYTVTLSAPESGEKVIYGANIALEGSVAAWTVANSASYALDLADADQNGNYVFDKYTEGRTVSVVKGFENVLEDDIFFTDVLEEIAPYCSYTIGGGETVKPVQPEEPQEPEAETADLRTFLPLVTVGGAAVGVNVNDGVSLAIVADKDAGEITINRKALTGGIINGNHRVFELPIGYLGFTEEYTVICGGRGITVNPLQELLAIANANIDSSDAEAALETLSEKAFAINLLNAAKYYGVNVTLSGDAESMLYPSGANNYYNVDWHWDDGRDKLQTRGENTGEEFAWGERAELITENGAQVAFPFTVPSGLYQDLKAVVTLGGRQYTVPVETVSEEAVDTLCRVLTQPVSPADFDEEIAVTVFDGNRIVSNTAYSSVMRLIAHTDNFGTEEEKAAGNLLYSLGKAACWYMNRAEVAYEYRPALSAQGVYSLAIGKYNYPNLLTVNGPLTSVGTSLYAGGTVTNSTQTDSDGAGFTVSKRSNNFSVMLGGANIDGIRTDGTPELVKINVNAPSVLNNVLVSQNGAIKASVIVSGDLTITGKQGVVLDIYGGIYVTGNLTIENIAVRIHGSVSVPNAVRVGGNVVINGNVSVENSSTGIYLEGDASQTLKVLGGSLKIDAADYGISGTRPEVKGDVTANTEVKIESDKSYANRWLLFEDGDIAICANNGLKYANIRLKKAALSVTAENGYTVDGEDIAVMVETVSGDYRQGKLVLRNETVVNPFWDVYYTLKVKTMLLNGGEVVAEGTCRGGVVNLTEGAKVEVSNSNFTVKNLQEDLKGTNSSGIRFAKSAAVNVTNSGKLIFKDCFTAVNSWLPGASAEQFGKIINRGIVVLDTYKLSLGWDGTNDNVLSWEMQFAYEEYDGGHVKSANRI